MTTWIGEEKEGEEHVEQMNRRSDGILHRLEKRKRERSKYTHANSQTNL